MKRSFILLFSLPLFFLCEFTGSMYKPDDPSYEPPSFTIDTTASNVVDGDTVSADTVRVTLIGNDEEYHRNRFHYKLDNGEWKDWEGDGELAYVIELTDLPGGTHTLAIEVCYHPSEKKTDSTISFFRAVRPVIADMAYTVLSVDADAPCTLTVKAEGTGEFTYVWYRDSILLETATEETLFIEEVTLADTGFYSCFVTNNWGEVTSPDIRLRVLFRVFYDGNNNTGGIVPVDTNGYEPGALAEPLDNTGNLARRGYAFIGWNMKADGSGASPESGLKFEIGTDNVILYAEWDENPSFTLGYDGNGAEKGNVPDSARMYRTGELVTIPGNSGDLEMPGYTFMGWNTDKDGRGNGYGENDRMEMGDKDITLYAQWSDNPTFMVIYHENGADGGEVPVDARKYEEGVVVTVAGNSRNLLKEGNTFTGWNTDAQGNGGKAYTPGATFVMGTKDVKLYARWTTNPVYTVTYRGNGNTAGTAPDSVSNEEDAEITVAGQGTLVKKGYSFTGWNTAADGSGKEYESNATYTIGDEDDTLYAQWEINRYKVTYDGNGDNVDNLPPPTTHRYNTEMTLDTIVPTRTGCTFFRWNTDSTGDGEDYEPGDEFTIGDGDATFYVRWRVNSYTIAFDGNDATAGDVPGSIDVDYDDSVTIPGKGDLQRTGYTFTGWNTAADGGTAYPADTTVIMGAEDLVLFAQWTINRYLVRFDPQGGSSVDSQYVDYDDTVKIPAAPTRTGHIFDGWYEDPGCTNPWVFGTIKINAIDTIYAKWLVACTVTFDGRSPATPPDPTSLVAGEGTAVGTLPGAPTKKGCIFAGWYTGIAGSGTAFTGSTPVTGDITVYALWTMTDREDNVYKTVTIGSQVWMAENLKVMEYRNGTAIPLITDTSSWNALATPGYCWNVNDASNKEAYGALYNWFTVNTGNLAPEGWHIPTDAEWAELENYLIKNGYNWDTATTENKIGKSLAAKTGWSYSADEGNIGNDMSTNNGSGFSAVPGGCRVYDGTFYRIGNNGYWWSATEIDASAAWGRNLYYSHPHLNRYNNDKRYGFSIRCVRD